MDIKQIQERQVAAAKALADGSRQTPIAPPINLPTPEEEKNPSVLNQTSAEAEAKAQLSGRLNTPLPESLQHSSNPAQDPTEAASALIRANQINIDGVPVKLSEAQNKALLNIKAVRIQAMATLGKKGCNPALYNKELLRPLEDGVIENRPEFVKAATALTCPEKPNAISGEVGALRIAEKDFLRRKQALQGV